MKELMDWFTDWKLRVSMPASERDWRVGLFWSSGSPGTKVRMLADGRDQIAEYQNHKDFIEWVDD